MYFYLMFSFCPSKFWQKSVDQWTSNDNSEKKSFSLMYILIYKCVICGQKVPFYFMFSFCYVLFTILTQKVWTRGQVMKILFISLFLLPYTLQNFDKNMWIGGQAMKFFEKNHSTVYILLFKCVDKNVSLYFTFSFCYVPFTMLTKSVERWTSNENSENKF